MKRNNVGWLGFQGNDRNMKGDQENGGEDESVTALCSLHGPLRWHPLIVNFSQGIITNSFHP